MEDTLTPNLSQTIGLGTSPQVWQFSDFDGYNQLRSVGYPVYLSMVQQARLERMRQARMLNDGRHWRLFLYENRTQFNFPDCKVNGAVKKRFVPYNLLKLIAQKSADLLFGDEPAIRVDEPLQQKSIADLVRRTHLHRLLYGMAKECAVDGECYIEAVIQQTIQNKVGDVYLKRVDAADIFPEGLLQPDGQYQSYVRYNAMNVGKAEQPDWRLLITRYLPGTITREVKALDQKGFILPKVLTLNEWPQQNPAAEPMEPETKTGLDRPSIIFVANEMERDIPISEFDGKVEAQDSLNASNTQLADVIAKHANPKLLVPARVADREGGLTSSMGVFFPENKDEADAFKYLTWNAELSSAMQQRNEVRDQLLIMAEMSPILLGIKSGAQSHNAYKSVRLEAINSLTKAQRKAVIWKAAIDGLLGLCDDMQTRIPGSAQYDRKDPGIEMRDGLPMDTDSKATEISTYRGCGTMSLKRAVELQLQDPAAVKTELQTIAQETAEGMPSILLTQPKEPAPPPNPQGVQAEASQESEIEIAA